MTSCHRLCNWRAKRRFTRKLKNSRPRSIAKRGLPATSCRRRGKLPPVRSTGERPWYMARLLHRCVRPLQKGFVDLTGEQIVPMTSGKPVRFLTRSTIKRQWLGLLIVSMLIIARLPTAAAEPARKWHPVAQIQAAAENYLKLSAGVSDERLIPTAGFLDPRLQLPLCSDLLDPFVRPGTRVTGRTIVGVRCSGVKPWKIYLPPAWSSLSKVSRCARIRTVSFLSRHRPSMAL